MRMRFVFNDLAEATEAGKVNWQYDPFTKPGGIGGPVKVPRYVASTESGWVFGFVPDDKFLWIAFSDKPYSIKFDAGDIKPEPGPFERLRDAILAYVGEPTYGDLYRQFREDLGLPRAESLSGQRPDPGSSPKGSETPTKEQFEAWSRERDARLELEREARRREADRRDAGLADQAQLEARTGFTR